MKIQSSVTVINPDSCFFGCTGKVIEILEGVMFPFVVCLDQPIYDQSQVPFAQEELE